MKILVPTDFSELSKVAVLYAMRLAKKLKADVILLTVINIHSSSASAINWEKLEDELIHLANQDAEKLIREVSAKVKGNLQITFRYVTGSAVDDAVEAFAVKHGVDLVIMGTRGASGLRKVLMGSNATAVINKSSVPVIAVPGATEFRQVKKIVYASDMRNINDEIRTITLFASFFNATVQVLHVMKEDSAERINRKKTKDDLITLSKYSKISFHVVKSDAVADTVDNFVIDQKADMLAMFTHRLDFYEKLFGKSVTREFAFHAQVPLLAFNRTTFL